MREALESALDTLIQKYSDKLYDFGSLELASNFEADIFAIKASIAQEQSAYQRGYMDGMAKKYHDLETVVGRLRGALIYHQEQTRPIQRTIDVLEGTK